MEEGIREGADREKVTPMAMGSGCGHDRTDGGEGRREVSRRGDRMESSLMRSPGGVTASDRAAEDGDGPGWLHKGGMIEEAKSAGGGACGRQPDGEANPSRDGPASGGITPDWRADADWPEIQKSGCAEIPRAGYG